MRPIADAELSGPADLFALYVELARDLWVGTSEAARADFYGLVRVALRLAPDAPGETLRRLLEFQAWAFVAAEDLAAGRELDLLSSAFISCRDYDRVFDLMRERGLDD